MSCTLSLFRRLAWPNSDAFLGGSADDFANPSLDKHISTGFDSAVWIVYAVFYAFQAQEYMKGALWVWFKISATK